MAYPVGRSIAVAAGLCMLLTSPAAVAQARPAEPPATPPVGPGVDPTSPLADLPGLGVAWPDLAMAPDEPAAEQRAAVEGETRYAWKIEGIDDLGSPLLTQRFDELSSLKANDGKAANAAQIDRRAREDSDLLRTLLRAEGYYDARVAMRVAPEGQRLLVTLEADPGTLYKFDGVRLAGVQAAGPKTEALVDAFGIKSADPVNADQVAAAEARLRAEVGAQGFAFGKVGEPELVVDHATRTATLDLSVAPGTARKFGKIVVTSKRRVFGADHVQEIARFGPGDPYQATDLDDLRRALIQTGLVSVASVKPVETGDPGTVDVAVGLEPAPPRTIAGELGYGTGEGARAEVSWTHRNLFPPEGALTLRGVLGTKEQLGSIIFRRNNFHARDRVLTAQITASNLTRDAFQAKTLSLSANLERQSNIFFQKKWTWSVGGEIAASDERDVIPDTGVARRQTYFIAALPGTLGYDGSDDLLNPTRGFRLAGRVSPELSVVGKAFGYTRTQFDASAYLPATPRVVLAGRVRVGTIFGAKRDAVAPSRRFYSGGGGSVRGYSYQAIGPRDIYNDPVGGRSLAEFSLEARVKAFGNFGVVPFFDGGNIYTNALPRFSALRYGAGLGVRYYSSFGPIRLDLGTPINPRTGDSRIAVYVSLGQAF